MVRGLLIGLLAIVFLGLGACSSQVSDRDIKLISASEAHKRIDKGSVLVIDARPPARYAEGHIAGARAMRSGDIDPQNPDPALGGYKTIIVYGENPGETMAKSTAKKLMIAEYKDVRLMSGGYAEWRANGLPVEIND
jgi:rhodanese-related sulfurtransferase